jgi:hypothetical protein
MAYLGVVVIGDIVKTQFDYPACIEDGYLLE